MTPKATVTKTDRTRQIIHELGFTEPNPPTGWHRQVQAKLAAEGITVNESLIYKLQKDLSGVGRGKKKRGGRKAKARVKPTLGQADQLMWGGPTPATPGDQAAMSVGQINGLHLVKLAEVAREMGGWGRLKEAVELLELLKVNGL